MRTNLARLAAYVAPIALVAAGTTLAVSPAAVAAPANDPTGYRAAATWLTGQLKGGLLPSPYGGPDYGLSIDAAMALQTIGGHAATVSSIADALQSGGTDYLQVAYTDSGHDYTSQAANATAKAMALMQSLSPVRTTVGTINLQSRLESQVLSTSPNLGRIADIATKDGDPDPTNDYANTLGQAYAAYALHAVGSSKATDVLNFLLQQQCPGGGFRLYFDLKTASSQSCTSDSSADTDATSIALTELKLIGTPAVATAVTNAVTWLGDQQKSDGSWGGGTSTTASNANSTGLATAALADYTHSSRGAAWLRAHQATPYDYCDALKGSQGAVAYDTAGLTGARSTGLTAANADQFRRATAQSIVGLHYLLVDDTPSTPRLTAPSGYVKARSPITLRVTGVQAGDQLCLRGAGLDAQGTSTGTTWTRTATTAPGTATRTYLLTDAAGHVASTTVEVLGAADLKLTRTAYRVTRGHLTTVTIGHLAPGERASLYYRHELVATGTAGPGGRFAATFRVGRALGTQPVVGYGQFGAIRDGRTVIKVVR